MSHAGEGGTGARGGVGGRGAGEAGFGGFGGGVGRGGLGGDGIRETRAQRKARKAKEAETVGQIGKVLEVGAGLATGPVGSLLVKGATKLVQSFVGSEKPGGFQAGDPGGLGREQLGGRGETLLTKGVKAATPAEAVAAQPDAAAKELEKKRRAVRGGRKGTILAGRKIAEEQRAKTLLGQ